MKKLLLLLCVLSIIACKEEAKDYVTLSGEITNSHESKILKVFMGDTYEKTITVNEDGTFSDTLKISEGDYQIKHGNEYGSIFLKNGYTSAFTTDYEDFDNTLNYEGDGADINNYGIKSYLLADDFFTDDLFADPTDEKLASSITEYKEGFAKLKDNYPALDSLHIANGEKTMNGTIKSYKNYLAGKIALLKKFPKGTPSPTFVNYENFKGGNTSLADLKGKYVYVDVWATWCGPCKREIPSLKKVEEDYHGKNIEFVSISIDDGRGFKGDKDAAKEGWKKMIADKEMGGVQLLSDNAWKSDFVTGYKINGIPRFILIDPSGNIVSADAPRPSSPKLIELFNSLNI